VKEGAAMFVIWLIIAIKMAGEEPITLVDKVQPDLATCWVAAQHAIEQAKGIEGRFEFQATCSIVKSDDPA
jgi:hypothetical protein